MADTTPLLPRLNSTLNQNIPNTKITTKAATPPSIDDTIENYFGSTGKVQLLQAVLIAFAWAFDAQQIFISVFTDAEPTWHCTNMADKSCTAASSPCTMPRGSWAWDGNNNSTSMVSEWGLLCSGPAIISLPASSFFAGCLAGGFLLSTLADSFLGRKKMLLASCLAMSLSGVMTSAAPNVWVYSALRFISGFGRAMIGTCTIVLSTEIVSKRWREIISISGFFFSALGFLSLPALAYIGRNSSWRVLYLWTSVPCFCYTILLYFMIQESPRWLLVQGRKQEAVDMLRNIATQNGNSVTSSFSMLYNFASEAANPDVFATLKKIWEKKWAFRRLAAIMTASFGVGFVYYGMPLNVGSLGPNLYLSVAYNALSQLPSALATLLLVAKMNRRSSLLVMTTASGLCSLLCVVLTDKMMRMAAEVAAFFATCTAFNVILIYTIELFPTCVRNSAVGLVRQALVLGGVAAPMLVAMGKKNSFLSFGVFGIAVSCCGLFVACLPETRGRSMCDTMEEEEYKEAAAALSRPFLV